MLTKKKAQSTLEYVIILSGIIIVAISAATIFAPQSKDTGIGKLMDKSAEQITNQTQKIADLVK